MTKSILSPTPNFFFSVLKLNFSSEMQNDRAKREPLQHTAICKKQKEDLAWLKQPNSVGGQHKE